MKNPDGLLRLFLGSLILTILPARIWGDSQVSAGNLVIAMGQTGTVSIMLQATGTENALGCSFTFDPGVVTFLSATPGRDVSGAMVLVNTNQANAGKVGFALALQSGSHFGVGGRELVKIDFRASDSNFGTVALAFGDVPIRREISDASANLVSATYSDGSVTVKPSVSHPSGSLQVMIAPADAVNVGAQWRVDGGLWQASGAVVPDLSIGSHTISFSTVLGWTTPADQIVSVAADQTTVVTATYVAQVGSLQVTLMPTDAVSLGAHWRVDSGPLQASGTTLSNLSIGSHTISFSTVLGWTTPADQIVSIAGNQTTVATATYVAQVGSLHVTLLPAEAVSAGAEWRVDAGPWQASGTTLSNLSIASYTISFSTVLGWTTPADQIVSISANQTTYTTASYMPIIPFSDLTIQGGAFSFVLHGAPGSKHSIEVSVDLITWTSAATLTIPAQGSIRISDPAPSTQLLRFYRDITQ
jgi:hypothetical protein